MGYKICRIENFDKTSYAQQLVVLQNAKELLAFLWDETSLPYEVYRSGTDVLQKAIDYVDGELIHGDSELAVEF